MAYYGNEWEMQVSKAKAQKILGENTLPRMGYETTVKTVKCDYDFTHHLVVNNISGIFYIACCSIAVREWVSIFNFDLKAIK